MTLWVTDLYCQSEQPRLFFRNLAHAQGWFDCLSLLRPNVMLISVVGYCGRTTGKVCSPPPHAAGRQVLSVIRVAHRVLQ